MLNTISTQAKFFISAIAFTLIGFLLVLFLPIVLTETLYFNRENIILLTPQSNLLHFTFALLLIVVALILLGVKRNTLTFALAAGLVIAGISYSSFSLTNYIAVQEEQIIIKNFNELAIYPWESIIEMTYEYTEGPNGVYTFKTANDEQFSIDETGKFGTEIKQKIYLTALNNGVAFVEKSQE